MYVDSEIYAAITNTLIHSKNMSIVSMYNERSNDTLNEIVKQQFEIIRKSSSTVAFAELYAGTIYQLSLQIRVDIKKQMTFL
ncbi:MAG: hypothetical protein IJY19_07170 [Ruminococcus sp.]|nr:hypothetical protein [Ruminococcus sp.]